MNYKAIFTVIICFLGGMFFAQTEKHNHSHTSQNIEFVKNNNQWNSNILFKADLPGGIVFMETNGFTYNFSHPEDRAAMHDLKMASQAEKDAFVLRAHAWRINFIDADFSTVETYGMQKHYYNYFIGNDESKWAGHVPIFHSLRYKNMYQGIDLKTYSHKGNFKYDWIIAANSDPDQIVMDIDGIDNPQIIDGNLILNTSVGKFTESKPYAYQIINGNIFEVQCNYILTENNLSFEFPNGYDTTKELVIDPELIAATLSGTPSSGWADNYGHTATFDIEGNIYTGCTAGGDNYPATTGAYQITYGGGGWDCGISKLNPNGSDLLWATFIGGSNSDYPHSMVTNGNQELYIYGSSSSDDYPTTSNAFQSASGGSSDIIITHLSADGSSLIGSTYMGGSMVDGVNALSVNYGDSYRGEIIIDHNNKPVIASCSSSANFPTSGGAYQSSIGGQQDAVVFRLNETLSSLEMSTYFGGPDNDNAYAVKATIGDVIFIGGSAGDNLPITAGVYQSNFLGGTAGWGGDEMDGFVASFNSSGNTLLASTYVGTDSGDQVFFLELDSEENVFIYGQGGIDWLVIGDVFVNSNAPQFISRLNPSLTNIDYSTTIGISDAGGGQGGGSNFVPDAFLVDNCDNIYISGYNAFGTLPLTDDALYTTGGFYLAVFSPLIEELEYGTMYSGDHVDGGTSRFDRNGTVYQAVCSGGGFNTTTDAYATNQATGWDIGVFKINFDVSGVNASISGADINGCAPFVTTFENFSNGDQYFWDFGDGGTSTEYEPDHTFEDPGVYTVSLIVTDSLSCNLADTSSFDIIISVPIEYTPSFDVELGCNDLSATCTNSTGIDFLQYIWDFGDGTEVESYDADHIYNAVGEYTILLTAIDNGCNDLDTISIDVNVIGEITAAIETDNLLGCAPFTADLSNLSAGSLITWDYGDGSELETGSSVSHLYEIPGIYTVSVLVQGLGNCNGEDSTTVEITVIQPLADANFVIDQTAGCEEMLIQTENLSTGDNVTYLWEFGDGETSVEVSPEHNYTGSGNYTIVLSVFDNVCNAEYTSEQNLEIAEAPTFEIEDLYLCYHNSEIMADANNISNIESYLWSTNETTETIELTTAGNYTVQVFVNNCWIEDEFVVHPVAKLDLDSPLRICQGTEVLLSVPYSDGNNFIWNTNETNHYISVNEPGEYTFDFDDSYGCHQSGMYDVHFTNNSATIYIPNAFTPNNDGINDYFKAVTDNLDEYVITIWNRWGEVVFQSEDKDELWMGEVQPLGTENKIGEPIDYNQNFYTMNGIYSYQITFSSLCNTETEIITGSIAVMR